jgi:hypothetical protein
MKRSIQSFAIGTTITVTTFGLSYGASIAKFVALSHILYWQGWWLQTFLPCLNIGTIEKPMCEGTPLNIAVFFAGVPFGMLFYSLVAFGILSVWKRRAA